MPSVGLFEQVASLIEREFYDVAYLHNEWVGVRARFEADFAVAADTAEREAVITGMLDALGVSHSILITPELTSLIAGQADAPERFKPSFHRHGSTLLARIPSFKVRSTRLADLQRLADAMAGARQLVLDLRVNDGGAGSVVVELASMFLPPDTPVLRVRDRVGNERAAPFVVHAFRERENLDHERELAALRGQHAVEYRTKADALGRYGGEVVVLLDRTCYSCGEVFVQCMKEFSNATVVGQPSPGFVVAADEYVLSDGYRVILPFAEMRSGKDAVIEGVGVSPHVMFDIADLTDADILRELGNRKVLAS